MARTRETTSSKSENSTTATKTTKARPAAAKTPTYEDIALRAYHIYLERNGSPGDPMEDWVRAEQELAQPAAKPGGKLGPKLVAA